jgi:hypothetical protein
MPRVNVLCLVNDYQTRAAWPLVGNPPGPPLRFMAISCTRINQTRLVEGCNSSRSFAAAWANQSHSVEIVHT